MAGHSSFLRGIVFCGVLGAASSVFAVNRFEIRNQQVMPSQTGVAVAILGDLDQNTYAFSVALAFDRTKIRVNSVGLGAAIAGLSPEYSNGQIDNATGRLHHGVVFALSVPRIDVNVAPGQDRELLILNVDVLTSQPGTTTLDLRDTNDPGERNVMSNINGESVSPDPTLVDGTITIPDLTPQITSFTDNSGRSGDVFLINGSNFDQPGRVVRVCGRPATATLVNPTRLSVTAPTCADAGPTTVEVCTDFGCDSDPAGFTYEVADAAPVITQIVSNSGFAGTIFFADGRNFDQPGLQVFVCSAAATFTLLNGVGSLRTLQITAPSCADAGFADLRVCTNFGCDTRADGFDYRPTGGLQIPGDCNQDGTIDLSDGVCIFGFLFLGNPVDLPCGNGRATDPGNRALVDFNGDNSIDLSDGVAALRFLFQGGPPHPLGRPPACVRIIGCANGPRCN